MGSVNKWSNRGQLTQENLNEKNNTDHTVQNMWMYRDKGIRENDLNIKRVVSNGYYPLNKKIIYTNVQLMRKSQLLRLKRKCISWNVDSLKRKMNIIECVFSSTKWMSLPHSTVYVTYTSVNQRSLRHICTSIPFFLFLATQLYSLFTIIHTIINLVKNKKQIMEVQYYWSSNSWN